MITSGTLVLSCQNIMLFIGRPDDVNFLMQNMHIFRSSNFPLGAFLTLCDPLYLFYNKNRGSYFVLLYVECCNRSLNTCSSTRSWVMMNKTLFPHLEILYFKWPSHQERRTRQVKHFKFFGDNFFFDKKWWQKLYHSVEHPRSSETKRGLFYFSWRQLRMK